MTEANRFIEPDEVRRKAFEREALEQRRRGLRQKGLGDDIRDEDTHDPGTDADGGSHYLQASDRDMGPALPRAAGDRAADDDPADETDCEQSPRESEKLRRYSVSEGDAQPREKAQVVRTQSAWLAGEAGLVVGRVVGAGSWASAHTR